VDIDGPWQKILKISFVDNQPLAPKRPCPSFPLSRFPLFSHRRPDFSASASAAQRAEASASGRPNGVAACLRSGISEAASFDFRIAAVRIFAQVNGHNRPLVKRPIL